MSAILGPQKSYLEIMDEKLVEKTTTEATSPRRFNPLRPSSAGKCSHELSREYAEFKGLLPTNQEIIQPELQRIFAMGSSIEWMMIKAMRETGLFNIKYTQQVLKFMQLSDGTWLEGSMDLSVFFDGHGGICDWKSKKDRHSSFGATAWDEASEGYAKMKSVNRVTDKLFYIDDLPAFLAELNDPFLPANFLQLNIYANTQFVKDSGIDHCSLLFFNKNDCRLREMRFRPSEKVFAETVAKFNLVHNCITGASEADVAHKVASLKCKPSSNCRYCWPEESKRAYFATLKPKVWPKDIDRLGADGKKLSSLFQEYEEGLAIQEATSQVESQISKIMIDIEEDKIRLANGNVYENKFLKSPRPHHALRRSKA